MPEVIRKLRTTQALREQPQLAPATPVFLTPAEEEFLEIVKGEKVKTGNKVDVPETVGGETFKWIFVEAIDGAHVDKRKGYVPDAALDREDAAIEMPGAFQPFPAEVEKEAFADACYVQAELSETNPAYLYALAFAQSGGQWSATHVETNHAANAPAVGVFGFSKDTWATLLNLADAGNLTAAHIKFPTVQCVMAAILAAKSASLLKGLITDRALSAVDLYLAHLFADDNSFGSNAAAKILQAEKDNKDQPSGNVINQIYQDPADRTAFFARTTAIFNGGNATIAQALATCASKLDAGFAQVKQLASEIKDSIPSDSDGPVFNGQFQGKVIALTEEDVDALARVSQSEVGNFGQFGQQVLVDALAAVVDTVFNRVVYHTTEFPKTVQGVIDQPKQFSAINPIRTWKLLPSAKPEIQNIVRNHVLGRAKGAASKIKGAMHFFNPDTSSPDWGGPIEANPIVRYGVPNNSHIHGFPSGYRPPEAYAIKFGNDTCVFTGDGRPQGQLAAQDGSSNSIVAAALKEWNFWGKSIPGRVGHKDNDLNFATYVRDTYCKPLSARPPLSDIQNDVYFWSAVTISYCLRQAGLSAPAITLSQRHSTYIREAVKARKTNDNAKLYWGFRITEAEAVLAPGDIIGCMRKPGMTHAQAQPFFDVTEDYESHTDIVVAVRPGKADVIGGNVSDSVTMKTVNLDASGKLVDTSNPWFVVMKKRK